MQHRYTQPCGWYLKYFPQTNHWTSQLHINLSNSEFAVLMFDIQHKNQWSLFLLGVRFTGFPRKTLTYFCIKWLLQYLFYICIGLLRQIESPVGQVEKSKNITLDKTSIFFALEGNLLSQACRKFFLFLGFMWISHWWMLLILAKLGPKLLIALGGSGLPLIIVFWKYFVCPSCIKNFIYENVWQNVLKFTVVKEPPLCDSSVCYRSNVHLSSSTCFFCFLLAWRLCKKCVTIR